MENQKNDHELPAKEQISSEDEIVKLATAEKWAEIYGVSTSRIRARLHDAGIIGITGKKLNGRILREGFYSEEDVRVACQDHFLPELPHTGILELNGIQAIGENKYAAYRGVAFGTLHCAIIAADLKPFGKARSGSHTIDLYEKSQVDSLPCLAPELSETGILELNGIQAIGENKYALHRGISWQTLHYAISAAGLKSIGRARSGSQPINLYAKSQVDALSCLAPELSETGILDLNGIHSIGVSKYAQYCEMWPHILQNAITAAGLKPVGRARSGNLTIDLYNKSQVDALPCFSPKLPQTGILERNGIQVIGVRKYARHTGINPQALNNAIIAASLKSIAKARSGRRHIIDLYDKSKVDALPCFSPQLPQTGILEINGIQAVGECKYASHCGSTVKMVRDAILRAGLKPIGKATSGGRIIDVYDKSEVDALPCFFPELPESGIIDRDGIQSIGVCKYAPNRGADFGRLYRLITAAALKPTGKARSGTHIIDLYDKSEVDALPCFFPELPESGILDLNGIQAIGVNKYVQYRGINVQTLHRAIIATGLKLIGRARSGTSIVDLYDKSQVDALFVANAHKWKNLKNTEDLSSSQQSDGASEE